MIQTTIELAEPIGSATRLVVVLNETVPVNEAEIELMLHWAGDLFTDLMKPKRGG